MVQLTKIAAAAILAGSAIAHPGEVHEPAQIRREIAQREATAHRYARSLGKCANSLKAREAYDRAVARRAAKAEQLRAARGITNKPYLHRRDIAVLEKFEEVDHNKTGTITSYDNESLFGATPQCLLTPENIIGPYYVTGEYVRSNVTEGQAGVPVHLEFQFTDINTCEPVEGVLADIWAANATGVYSGVSTEEYSQGGLNTTFLRGLQQSDEDGVAAFDTIFPGHYTGRATHEHVVVHQEATLLANGSYSGGKVTHIGQLFFDEELRSAVEETYPYNTNTLDVVLNDDDQWTSNAANNTQYDPFPEYVYLDPSDITQGLLIWINIGIDTSSNHTEDATAVAYLAADGGHDTGDSFSVSKRAVPHSYAFGKLFSGSARRLF